MNMSVTQQASGRQSDLQPPAGLRAITDPTAGAAVETDTCTGTVLSHGAQVLRWAPHGTGPVLWVSSRTSFQPLGAIRGGVPVCFPWFGPKSGLPQHGPARNVEWHLEESGAPDGIAHLLYRLSPVELRGTQWHQVLPTGVTAYLSVAMADRLRIDLTVSTDTDAFDFEAALHSYFSVGDAKKITIDGLDGCSYLDKVHPRRSESETQQGTLMVPDRIDRVYNHEGTVTITDPLLHRSIVLAKRHSASTVVWNPGPDKVIELTDIEDADWDGFVCVEAGNVGENAVHLEPGQSHTMSLIVDVRLEA